MTSQYTIIAMYKFVDFPDYKDWQQPLKNLCAENNIKGTLLLAKEGINGTVAGSQKAIEILVTYLTSDKRFADLDTKTSYANKMPFFRIKVRLKKEIVTLGQECVNPTKQVGEYVDPQDWNKLIDDPETIVIDTRNDYEIAIGKFKNAVNPNTESFRELPKYVKENLDPKKHKKIAMYCTGGIRCEKSTSYLLAEGFENVYHLKGGILKYLETIPADKSKWEGECFVFDQRVAVKHGLEVGKFSQCHGCRHPLSPEDLKSKQYQVGVSCPHCYEELSAEKKKRRSDRQFQMELASQRKTVHIGQPHSYKDRDASKTV